MGLLSCNKYIRLTVLLRSSVHISYKGYLTCDGEGLKPDEQRRSILQQVWIVLLC